MGNLYMDQVGVAATLKRKKNSSRGIGISKESKVPLGQSRAVLPQQESCKYLATELTSLKH